MEINQWDPKCIPRKKQGSEYERRKNPSPSLNSIGCSIALWSIEACFSVLSDQFVHVLTQINAHRLQQPRLGSHNVITTLRCAEEQSQTYYVWFNRNCFVLKQNVILVSLGTIASSSWYSQFCPLQNAIQCMNLLCVDIYRNNIH